MQIFKFFLWGVLFTFGVLGFIAWGILPSSFEIKEEIKIEVSSSKVYNVVNDLQTWETWVMDPNEANKPKISFSTLKYGEGATMFWEYPDNTKMEVVITEAVPTKNISLKFHSIGSDQYTNISIYIEKTAEDKCKVTWVHAGSYGWSITSRLSASILDFEGQTAAVYQKQLERLKQFCEK